MRAQRFPHQQWNPSDNWTLIEAQFVPDGSIVKLGGNAVEVSGINYEASPQPSVRVVFTKGNGDIEWADLYSGQRVEVFTPTLPRRMRPGYPSFV